MRMMANADPVPPLTTHRVEDTFTKLHRIARRRGALAHVRDGHVGLVMLGAFHQVVITHTVVV